MVFVARSHDTPNASGLPGSSLHDTSDLAPGGGMHGGLHRNELNNWLALGGSAYRTNARIEAPAGIVDVLPTVFATLGLPGPAPIDGRSLREAFEPDMKLAPVASSKSVADHTLHTTLVADTLYLDQLTPTG